MCIFFFWLLLFLVAVLIVPGGFERGCLLFHDFCHLEQNSRTPQLYLLRNGEPGSETYLPYQPPPPPPPPPRPSFGAFGQKVVSFDKSPPPVPFRTTVPFCPLAGEPGAVILVGRGLVGPSPELSSWIAPLMLAVVNSISSWSFEAADATNHRLIIWYCGLFIFCSGVVCGGGGVLYAEGAPRGTGFSEVIASNVSNRVRQ